MKEMILKEESLDMVAIEEITTLEQADEILNACNDSDGEVLEVYVNNAITRGAVYHRLTGVEKPNGNGEYMVNEDIGERYGETEKTIRNYRDIFDNRSILLRLDKGDSEHVPKDIKPTLRSLLDTIKKDPDNVTKMITHRITSRGINNEIARVVEDYMETANEDIRYLFSTKSRVALGRLATAIKDNDENKIIHIIKLDGHSEADAEMEYTKQECSRELKNRDTEISELKSENEMLKRRNKFLVDSYKPSDVKRFLSKANKNKGILKRYKPELEEAMDVLGVDATVDIDKLKRAYKNKVSIHHSDITGDDEMFRKIIEANNLVKKFIEGL